MSIHAMVWAINCRVGDPALKVLLISISNYANDDWQCWPRVKTLAHDSECSERSIQRFLSKLSDLGFIRMEPRFDASGRQLSSMIHLVRGEGANLSPPPVLSGEGDKSEGGRVTASSHRGGDCKVSPLNEPSLNRNIEEPSLNHHTRESRSVSVANDWPTDYENTFWTKYPNKKAKAHAMKALARIAKAGKTRWEDLITGLDRYILSREVQRGFVKHPATWLNAECWKDQEQNTPLPVERPQSFFEVAAEAYGNANAARTDQSGEW